MAKLLKPLLTLLRLHKRSPNLPKALASATRINPPPTQDETTSTALQRLMPAAAGDGLWKCCNAHEQELVHWSGAHPFKFLKCERCEHVFCRECCTTEVLRVAKGSGRVYGGNGDGNGERVGNNGQGKMDGVVCYGQVCSGCGLTHRARRGREGGATLSYDGVVCACGRVPDEGWVVFRIGSIEAYRRNPHEAFSELLLQRAEGSVLQQDEGRSGSESSSGYLLPAWMRNCSPLAPQRSGASSSRSSLLPRRSPGRGAPVAAYDEVSARGPLDGRTPSVEATVNNSRRIIMEFPPDLG